jgi:LysR family glycine cleavage system transcriptional activator
MRRLPPLNALRAFEAAARHESFTRAAEELHVTHGAVSRQVALLEAWLGRPLFVRARSQVRLTEAGRRYLADVTPALDRIAVASAHTPERGGAGTLLVSAPPTFTMRWLIPRLSAFQRRHAECEIKLTTSIAAVDFQHQGYDLAIRAGTQPLLHCRSLPFMTETIVPVCHADLVERGLRAPAELSAHTLIGYETEPYAWADWLAAAGMPGLQAASTLNFEQMYFALQAAAEGLGVVLVPLFLVADDIIAGRLVAPFGVLGAKQRRYYANLRQRAETGAPLAAFCDWLVQEGQATERSIEQGARGMGLADRLKAGGGAAIGAPAAAQRRASAHRRDASLPATPSV